MSAVAPTGGQIRQLDAPTQPDQNVSVDDVADPPTLARLFMTALRDIAKLKRRWSPDFIDFRDVTVDATGTARFVFPHGFGTAVNYWPVKWSGATAPCLRVDAASDYRTLVLTSTVAGLVTIRVERAG